MQFRTLHGGGVDVDLLGARQQHARCVGHRANAAAHGERNEDLRGHRAHDVDHDVALVAGSRDVVEDQLVEPALVVLAAVATGSPMSLVSTNLMLLASLPSAHVEAGEISRLLNMICHPSAAKLLRMRNPIRRSSRGETALRTWASSEPQQT